MSKKSVKSAEEFLKEALVPIEEQPYEIPANWVWVKLGSIIELAYGKSLPTSQRSNNGYPVFGSNGIVGYHSEFLIGGPVIVVGRKGSHGEVNWFDESGWAIDTTYYVKTKIKSDFRFIYYLLKSLNLKKLNRSTAIPGLNREDAYNEYIPLPPLNEQKRIADKVEGLLSKINQVKQLIEEAKETFEHRRAAILEKAFRGELTKKWRKENQLFETAWEMVYREHESRLNDPKNRKAEFLQYAIDNVVLKDNKLPKSWITAPVGFLCDCIVPGRDKPKSFSGDIPWVTIPDIISNSISESYNGLYLTADEITEVNAKIIPPDSVIMSCVGRFGISAVVKRPLVINQQLHAFLPSSMIIPKYLMYHIKILGRYMESISTSTTIAYLNKKNANSLKINLPPLDEQKKIVEIIDELIENEEKAFNIIANEVNFEELQKSILSKAFRGELGTGSHLDAAVNFLN